MQTFENTDAILDFAIAREEESRRFYTGLATRMERQEMKRVFNEFAAEELGHKKKIEAVKRGDYIFKATKKIMDMKIADYVVAEDPRPDIDYQDALIIAMKKEKASFRLYSDLAASTDNPELQKLFHTLATEEARHKLRFELEYDDTYLEEN
ncbi:MAG: ferritin family protein [Spirochaetales bacterium]|nr:ferritin family protein [Spirochaetales bacterium]